MSATIKLHTFAAFAAGVIAAIIAALTFNAVRADAVGSDEATFVSITPCRLLDTRLAPDRVNVFSAFGVESTSTIQAVGTNGNCTIPADAVGLSLNVTAIGATAPTFLTVWPDGNLPKASSLNPAPGQPPTPNAVSTNLSGVGAFNVFNKAGTVDVIIDVNGYYTNATLTDLAARLAAVESDVDQIDDRATALENGQPFAATARTAAVNLGATGLTVNEYTVVSMQVVPPVAGHLTVNSTLHVEIDDQISGAAPPWTPLQCSITSGTTLDADYIQDLNREKGDIDKDQLSGTRTLTVAGGASVDVNLVCQHDTDFTTAIINDATLTAIFTAAP